MGSDEWVMGSWVHRELEERTAQEKRDSEYEEQRVKRMPRISEMTWEEVQIAKSEVSRTWDGGWECKSAWAQLKHREAEVAQDIPLIPGNRASMKAYLARRQAEDNKQRPGRGYTRHGGGVSAKPERGVRRWTAS